jgi:hypothetical protein
MSGVNVEARMRDRTGSSRYLSWSRLIQEAIGRCGVDDFWCVRAQRSMRSEAIPALKGTGNVTRLFSARCNADDD